MRNLDKTDIMILQQLQTDSHLTTKELAAAVNLSPSPTFERQKRLESEGYIKKYVAILNPEKVGDSIMARATYASSSTAATTLSNSPKR